MNTRKNLLNIVNIITIKNLVIIFTFLTFNFSSAFVIDKEFYTCIENQKALFHELKKYLQDISFTTELINNEAENTTLVNYHYVYSSDEAKNALNNYWKTSNLLEEAILKNSLGDGFILGILAACCNKMLRSNTLDKKSIFSIIACTIGMVIYQNHKIGVVPSIDRNLELNDNQFKNVGTLTVARVLTALVAASISYLGTSYTLSRISNATQELGCMQK